MAAGKDRRGMVAAKADNSGKPCRRSAAPGGTGEISNLAGSNPRRASEKSARAGTESRRSAKEKRKHPRNRQTLKERIIEQGFEMCGVLCPPGCGVGRPPRIRKENRFENGHPRRRETVRFIEEKLQTIATQSTNQQINKSTTQQINNSTNQQIKLTQ